MLNVLALVLSILSAAVSVVIALRQSDLTRQTNELPILVELTQEFRSTEFQEAESYVLSRLTDEISVGAATSSLPSEAKQAVTTMISFFLSLGAYGAFGLADEKIIISLFGYRANRLWQILEPYILAERELRGDDHYCFYFEDLVCRTRDAWLASKGLEVEIRRLDDP